MKIRLYLLILFFFTPFFVKAQSNPCGVVAAMYPDGDTVVYEPNTYISLLNASTNATDFRFIVNGIQNNLNQEFNLGIPPGLLKVQIVAYNGTCTDTATTYMFNPGTYYSDTDNYRMIYGIGDRYHEIKDLDRLSTGGYLITGTREGSSFYMENTLGLLIRTKPEGCIEWAKMLDHSFGSSIFSAKESADGNIYFRCQSGATYNIYGKMDLDGNLLWSKVMRTPGGNHLQITAIEPMPDGGLAVVGHRQFTELIIVRLTPNGDIVWQKEVGNNFSFSASILHLLYKDGYLYAGGFASFDNNSKQSSLITKVNFNTGATVWSKFYEAPQGLVLLRNMIDVDSVLLVNITGYSGSETLNTTTGLMRVDTSGQVQTAHYYVVNYTPNNLVGPFNPLQTSVIRSGNTYYLLSTGYMNLSLQPGITYSSFLASLDNNLQFNWGFESGGSGASLYYHLAEKGGDSVMMGGREFSPGAEAYDHSRKLVLKPSGGNGENQNALCFSFQYSPQILNIPVTSTPLQWTLDQAADFEVFDAPVTFRPSYVNMRFRCPDYVDSCSFLRLSGERSVCNLNQTYTYTVHKNGGCGQPTTWQLPPGVSLISQTNTTITVQFPAFGRYVIYGRNQLSCNSVEDSIVILAESRTPPLELGAPASLCPQNSMTLRAGTQFFSYLWQDGSTDSTLLINQPGLYWVEVTDSCSNVLRDSIQISPSPPIPISIGPDLQKCNDETIMLEAPAGFINYTWGPDYNINSLTNATVLVNPNVDTSYMLRAEKTPGCFAFDTVFIRVYHSPPIDLGEDVRFCAGDSVLLNAGAGFQSYQWSNGNQNASFYVKNQGTLSVIGTTAEGCESTDTIIVLSPYLLPQPQLDQNNVLCEGDTRTLSPGPQYVSYLWSNGSTNPSLVVNDRGIYSVEVIDGNGCRGLAMTEINQIQPLPRQFLFPDTAICAYGTIDLHPLRVYSDYFWSNGSRSPQITISTPGLYWLEVKDGEGCFGRDSLLVTPKECLTGLYVPSAFTPNGDGKNDRLRPMLFGQIEQFEFYIYNRWGQVVFRSTDPGDAWDGRISGREQDTNVFVWICRYQLSGEPPKVDRGTITLIR